MIKKQMSIAAPWRIGLIAAFCAVLAACAPPLTLVPARTTTPAPVAAAALTPLPMCLSYGADNVVLNYAIDQGIFRDYGLDVSLHDTESGSSSVSAMIADEFDVCQVAGAAVVNAVAAGEDLVIIAGLIDRQVYSLVVKPEIEDAQDLIGKALAISRPGSASDVATRNALRILGLEPDTDVAIVAIGGQSERLAAMVSGAVAGTLVSVPENVRARALGYRELLTPAEMNTPFQDTVIATSREFLANHRDTATSLLKAISVAVAQMKEDREGTIQAFAKMQGIDPATDPDYVAEVYDVLVRQIIVSKPYPSPEGIQALIDLASQENAAAALTPDQVIDISILQEIEDSGFFDKLSGQ